MANLDTPAGSHHASPGQQGQPWVTLGHKKEGRRQMAKAHICDAKTALA